MHHPWVRQVKQAKLRLERVSVQTRKSKEAACEMPFSRS